MRCSTLSLSSDLPFSQGVVAMTPCPVVVAVVGGGVVVVAGLVEISPVVLVPAESWSAATSSSAGLVVAAV